MLGDRSIWKLSIFSVQFCCELKTALKIIKSVFQNLDSTVC